MTKQSLVLLAAAALAALPGLPAGARAADAPAHHAATTGVVLNVLYNEPHDPAAFEAYYAGTHLPLVARIKGVDHTVLIKSLPNADGSKPAYYRIAQLYFTDPAQMAAALGSPEGQAAVADLKNFADGGVSVVVGEQR